MFPEVTGAYEMGELVAGPGFGDVVRFSAKRRVFMKKKRRTPCDV
jgi:hypothetical protein